MQLARLSRYHKYNKKLPGRYLSELSPNSMPLADAKVHLARARLAFQKKLRRLDTQFKLANTRAGLGSDKHSWAITTGTWCRPAAPAAQPARRAALPVAAAGARVVLGGRGAESVVREPQLPQGAELAEGLGQRCQ